MSTGKRLYRYAALYKKTILLALIMLAFAVSTELTGPFIAKKIIDTHVLGIEYPWYETANGEDAVSYDGHRYKRSDHYAQGEEHGKEVRVLQVGRSYYFVDQALGFDGVRVVKNGKLTVSQGNQQADYAVQRLSTAELFAFYQPEIRSLAILVGTYFTLLLVSSLFHYGQIYWLQTAANRIIQQMRFDVFRHIQRLPIGYFDNLPAGKIVSRVTNDTEAIRDLYVTVLATFFTSSIYIAGIFIALFLLDVKLALICLLLLPILVIWIVVYRKFASEYNHRIRSRLSDINGMINESIQGMPIIRVFRRQKQIEHEFEQMNEDYFKFQNKLLSLNSMTSHNLVTVLRNLAFAALIWHFGGASLGGGSVISLGVLYAFVDYLNRMFQPITGMVNQLAQLEQARVAAYRVFELMDEEGVDVATGKFDRYDGNVEFTDVSFAYKDEDVLKHISFAANRGETVAFVGHTGSGKSSIMNLLFRFYDTERGTIRMDGRDIREIPKQWLRQHMGIVLQDPFLFTGTIATNVNLNDPSISRETVEKALRDVGADRILGNLPKGLDEPVIEKGSTLSAGQRQLISFARALAFDPAVLILDEATASIDTETEAVIQQALEVLKQGRTTFIIAHRLSTIRSADHILVLHRGEIVERGTHEALMKTQGRYYQMYQLQQGAAVV